ncbi:MAG: hypothetical protein ACJA0U_001386 [Salibacteraceae bacterium]
MSYTDIASGDPLKITTWDAFGYYMYLPSSVIYDDMTELEWVDEMDSTYQLTGGQMYQAHQQDNGKYVFKYLGGVSLMQAPFFFLGHTIAVSSNYKANGFSPPYQYSIAFGALFYCIFALFLMRNILLRFYSDHAVALSILLMVLATNLIQYISIDSAQSHAFIFPLYAIVLYVTIKWHESPKFKWAALIGLIIGLATISRPTELIMLFIPLLWDTQTKESRKAKWQLVRQYRSHVIVAMLFGIIGIAPQLIYWKLTTGSFVYDVGSKWFFANPWFRVLFGFTNGWFIYTPITIFFILGIFYMKKLPFRRSVIVFCLLNIWIVIAWSDWRYGATFSTRALVQSYPIFLLPFTAFIDDILKSKWKYIFFGIGAYLIFVNWFQIGQYNSGIIHYRDMNAQYYSKVYLNSSTTPLEMSLLDTDEFIENETEFHEIKESMMLSRTPKKFIGGWGNPIVLGTHILEANPKDWIRVDAEIKVNEGIGSSNLSCAVRSKSGTKKTKIRLHNAISKAKKMNTYSFYMKLPKQRHLTLDLNIESKFKFDGTVESWSITLFRKK